MKEKIWLREVTKNEKGEYISEAIKKYCLNLKYLFGEVEAEACTLGGP